MPSLSLKRQAREVPKVPHEECNLRNAWLEW